MCAEFWTIRVDYECPMCGSQEDGELQTHWLGVSAGWPNGYQLGERLPHLRGIEAATIGHDAEDSFISSCRSCGGSVDWGARIEDEAVVRVWPYGWTPR